MTTTPVQSTTYRVLSRQSAMGRTRILIECPFCQAEVWAYVWSLCGGGKRCDCRAMLTGRGAYSKEQWADLSAVPRRTLD